MKAIRLDVETLQKVQQYNEADIHSTNLKELKKKYSIESKNKAYDPDTNKMETKNNSSVKVASEESEPLTT